jgi:UDP-N-acetylmuramoylalanine--D-glutamate ligase
MKNYKKFFKGKKITVMGLGLLGRGIGDTAFLAECGADLIVTDLKTEEQLKSSLRKLKKYKNIKYVLGEHRLEDFCGRDFILKAAGVPLGSPYIAEAKKNNIQVEMSASLFAKLSGLKIIGVTGTRGKSTVTYLVEHILKTADKKVLLGGNVRGVSTLSLLKKIKGIEYAVFELDSWQLQGFGDAKISPQISVFTTFYSDHLNYYKNDLNAYLGDKANIFLNQKKEDVLVVGEQAWKSVQKYKNKIKSKIIIPEEKLAPDLKINIPGSHNEYNAGLAVAVCESLNIKKEIIKKALKTFKSVEGRLEFLREFKGVKIYNDNNSTTPEATLVALKSLGDKNKKNIILIMGGSDKKLDMSKLIVEINKICKEVILLAGSGTDSIKVKIAGEIFTDFKKAVLTGIKSAQKGDILLFSPAFASFGMFNNEYERNDQFVAIIKALK